MAQESQKHLHDTFRRVNDVLFGNPDRLDRDLWLARFSDLMLTRIQFPAVYGAIAYVPS
jgi:DNA segregation ATPase FtsK/SpoIIIE, S-DNA-T family